MDLPKSHTSSPPRSADNRVLPGKNTTSTTKTSPQAVQKLLHLVPSSFCFPKHSPLFQTSHRQSIHTALGAVNRQGRAGKHFIVLKRVTLIYRLAIQTRLFYPSYDIETKTFWATVLADVREEEPLIGEELNVAALADVVGVYTQAYADAHGEEEDEEDDNDDGFDIAFELLTPKKRDVDPRKKLVSLVRVWAKLFRVHRAKKTLECTKTTSTTTATATAAAAADEPNHQAITNLPNNPTMPNQLPKESDAAYIARLETTIKSITAAEKTAQDTITELKRSQVLADEYHKNHNARLHATIDRMDTKIKELESELRLERMGAGGAGGGGREDDPWVPWREYAGHLDGGL